MTTASICTIGDEILIGQIVDTNSSAISRALGSIGVKVNKMVSIGDDTDIIIDCLRRELSENDIVIATGGLGPTKDDITKSAIATLSGSKRYVTNQTQLEIVKNILVGRGLGSLGINLAQADVPEKCEVIPNRFGTAPIMVYRADPSLYGRSSSLYSMPGVPFETENSLPAVISDIKSHYGIGDIFHRNIMTFGMAESALSEKIASWEDSLPKDMHLAYLPNTLTGVRLRLSIYGGSEKENKERTDAEIDKLRAIIGDVIYSYSDDTLEHAVGKLLKENGKTLSVAESCTGGEIAHLITTVPGASEYFLGSVTSYAIPVKEKVLGVSEETIETYGVVSGEVASAMAEGVRKALGSDYSVATTGLADKEGDGVNPGGTVWIGVSTPRKTISRRFEYHNDRRRNIERFASSALFLLLSEIKSVIDKES